MGAVTSFVGSALGLGSAGNVSGQDALDQIKARALEAQQAQQAQLTGLGAQQTQFGQMLGNQAMGRTDSPELRAITERALKNQMSMTRANRGVNPGLASRQAAQAGSQLGTAIGQQATMDQNKFANYLQGQQAYNSNLLSGAGQASKDLYAAQTAKRQGDQQMVGNLFNTGASILASDKTVKKNIKEVKSNYVMSDENQKTDIQPVDIAGQPVPPKKVPFIDMVTPKSGTQKGYFNNDLFAQVTAPQAAPTIGPDIKKYLQMVSNGSMTMGGTPAVGGNAVGPTSSVGEMSAGAPEMASLLGSDKNIKKNVSKIVSKKQDVPVVDSHRYETPYPADRPENKFVTAMNNSYVQNDQTKSQDKKAYVSSDENKKTDVKETPAVQNPKSFLDALTAYSYEYKNPNQPGAAPGRHISVMAQDLEKAGPVGKAMVKDTPDGKMVDYGRGIAQILANQAMLNKELKKRDK